MPDATWAELAEATGLSIAGVKWNIRRLKEANLVRRVGPDKGGHWEVIMPAAAEGQGKPSPMEKSSGRKMPNS
ncbi:MAG: winged helix-turn-helix domain-containing protein [Desulfovibrionaceae bacterium]|nr:winged helix-turn-helix domain-containing protein [Desulfovibrionaceae bacterium]